MKPEEINFVVSTHGHSDHIGNNNLFLNAIHIVGTTVSDKHVYFIHDFSKGLFSILFQGLSTIKNPFLESYKISDDIEVIATPGHTLTCVSVIVRNTNLLDNSGNSGSICVLSGDLFEKEDDVMYSYLWIEAGSENPAAQRKNRLKVAKLADWIVPGHGPIFKVTEEIVKKLEKDSLEEGF